MTQANNGTKTKIIWIALVTFLGVFSWGLTEVITNANRVTVVETQVHKIDKLECQVVASMIEINGLKKDNEHIIKLLEGINADVKEIAKAQGK